MIWIRLGHDLFHGSGAPWDLAGTQPSPDAGVADGVCGRREAGLIGGQFRVGDCCMEEL